MVLHNFFDILFADIFVTLCKVLEKELKSKISISSFLLMRY